MSLEEPQTHREWIEVWKLIHAKLWQQYANSESNERLLLEGTEKYGRPRQAAVEYAFRDVCSFLVRTDIDNVAGSAAEVAADRVTL